MRKRLMAVLAVFVLMPLVSMAAFLKVGDETFKPSDKTGYSYTFSSCAATASYSVTKGFVLTFGVSCAVVGDVSWGGEGLNIRVLGENVSLAGSIRSTGGGVLEINGPGRLQVVDGRISLSYSGDIKLFGAVVEITPKDGDTAMTTWGAITVDLSMLTIVGFQQTMNSGRGMKFRASMISIFAQGSQHGDIHANAAIQDNSVGCGGISICGCVVSVVANHPKEKGIEECGSYQEISIIDSCVTVVSDGDCFNGWRVGFLNVCALAVSRAATAVSSRYNADSDDHKVFFGNGKYTLCSAEKNVGIYAGRVEVDGGKLEVCSPDESGVYAWEYLMKDGSLKMVDTVDYKQILYETMSEAAVMGVIASYADWKWTIYHTSMLDNILVNLAAAVLSNPKGKAFSMVTSRRFCQLGGKMTQGEATHGFLACDYRLGTSFSGRLTPAFNGDSFNGDFEYYYGEYRSLSPTNVLGQTLTHVEYEPFWVYLNGGVTPTGCRVVFNANGGQCSTTSRQVAKGAEIGTLPTATWSGHVFDGWYTSVSGGTKVTATTKVTGAVTLYAHWRSDSTSPAKTIGEALGVPGVEWSSYDNIYSLKIDHDWTCDGNGSVRTSDMSFQMERRCGISVKVNGPTSMKFSYSKSFSAATFIVDCGPNFLYKDDMPGIKTEWKQVILDIPAGEQTVYIYARPGYFFFNEENEYNGFWIDNLQFGDFEHERVYLINYDQGPGSELTTSAAQARPYSNPLTYTASDLPLVLADAKPLKAGYEFVGWSMNGKMVTEIPKGTTGNLSITANWTDTRLKLTVKANNTKYGTVSGGGSYASGTKVTLTAKAKSGYVFTGWYTDKACTKKLNPEGYDNRKPSVKYAMPAKATIVYAKFVSKSSDKKALKFTSATKKLAKTATSCAAGKEMAALTVKASSASLPTLSMKDLPKGMSFDPATGKISGTPTKPGKYAATVTVKSAAGNKVSQKVKLYVTVPSGCYGTFNGYARVKTTPAYIAFTSDKYGKVSGKVTYKGKGYSFKASYSSTTATESKFTPSIKIGSTTYKPAIYVTKQAVGITVSEASGVYKDTFEVALQKKPSLIKAKKALAGMVGKSYTFKKGCENAELTKSGDKLTVKFAETDAVKVSGQAKGKKVSFSTSVLYSGKTSGETGDVYTAMVMLMSPTAKYYKCLTFTITVDPSTKKVAKVEKLFKSI